MNNPVKDQQFEIHMGHRYYIPKLVIQSQYDFQRGGSLPIGKGNRPSMEQPWDKDDNLVTIAGATPVHRFRVFSFRIVRSKQ